LVKFLTQIYNRYFSSEKRFVNDVRTLLGITPVRTSLYRIAFTHSSRKAEVGRNNERLELLGDAVFDLVVSEYIYKRYPYRDEGFLSEMRSKIVSRNQINALAQTIGLGSFVETSLSDKKLRNSSTLGNAFEAMLGALYLDQGYTVAYRFIYYKILVVHFDLAEVEELTLNFKSDLIQYCQKQDLSFDFTLTDEVSTSRGKKFTVGLYIEGELVSEATNYNKKQAEQAAAEKAVKKLGIKNKH
jgi:ribonuclease-3